MSSEKKECSGSVVEYLTRDRGDCRFEPHRHHCVVSLSKTYLSLLSTGSNQEDRPDITEKCSLGHKELNQTKTGEKSN